MGISPKPWTYCENNHFCWSPGFTPHLIKIFVAGIEIVPANWVPGDGGPANGYYDCYRVSPTSNYWDSGGDPHARLSLTPAMSKLQVWNATGRTTFYHEDLYHHCLHGFGSTMSSMYSKFCHGYGYRMPSEFLWDYAAKVMNSEWMDPKYECFPVSLTQVVVRVARIHDATNIKIKVDTS